MESFKVELLFSVAVASFTLIISFVAYLAKKAIESIESNINDHGERIDEIEQKLAAISERESLVTKMMESRFEDLNRSIERILNKLEENDRTLAMWWKNKD